MLDYLLSLDASAFEWINQVGAFQLGDWFFPTITDLHKTLGFKLTVFPGLLALLYYFHRKTWFSAFLFTISFTAISDMIGTYLFKKLVQRPRPFETLSEVIQRCPAGGFSFVSNHAMNTFTYCTFLGCLFPKMRWPLWGVALVTSYSRVYCGVHYPLDVICGGAMGIGLGFLAHALFSRYKESQWPKF